MMAVEEAPNDSYNSVLETSKLRPDVEPFVPKGTALNGLAQPQPSFSLDAPEFVPHMYGEMYWVSNQIIVAPSPNHPRFSIPRFRDQYLRQQRSRRPNSGRGGSTGGREQNGGPQYGEHQSDNNGQYQPPTRTYNKIETRSKRGGGGEQQMYQENNSPKVVQHHYHNETDRKVEKLVPSSEEDYPVLSGEVPSIEDSSMSYRAALLGADPPTPEEEEPVMKHEVQQAPTPPAAPTTEKIVQPEEKKAERPERPDRRNEKFVPNPREENPAEGGVANGERRPYFGRSNGRQKPTKGSGIELNIMNIIQDKKQRKKKVVKSANPVTLSPEKVVNQLDASAPSTRRGKEREDPKPKKLSKMKKIIVKEKGETSEQSEMSVLNIQACCSQTVTDDLNSSLQLFLGKLREFNDKAYKIGSAHKRRYCCGLREARKYLKLKRVKCIIIPPNIDRIVSKGGLFDCVHDIVAESTEQCVPIICGLNKTKISKILARPKSTITSAVSIFNYEGAESLWNDVMQQAAAAKELYQLNDETQLDDEDHSSDEGEEFEDDNNEECVEEVPPPQQNGCDLIDSSPNGDNDSVSSSFVDSGIENNEVSSLSLENGHTSGEG